MSTLPETVVVPTTEAAPAVKVDVTTTPVLDTSNSGDTPKGSREVAHDWTPKNLEDAFAEKMGEIKRRPKPGEEDKKVEGKVEGAADEDSEFDAIFEKGKVADPVAKAFQKTRQKLGKAKAQLLEITAKAAEAETLRARIAELEKAPKADLAVEAKIAELEAKAARADELAKLAEESEGQLAIAKVERSREFKRLVTEPQNQIEQSLISIAKRNEIKESDLLAALHKPAADRAEALKALIGDIDETDRVRLVTAFDRYEMIETQREQILGEARSIAEQMDKDAQAARQAEEGKATERTAAQKVEWEKAVSEKWTEVIAKAGIAPIEGAKAWNDALTQAQKFASEVHFSQLDVATQAEVQHRAAIFPMLLGKAAQLGKELAAAQAKIAQYEGASPNAGDGRRSTERTAASSKPKTAGGFHASVEERFAEAGLG